MLAKAGLEVVIQAGAGVAAGYPDAQYQEKGAKVLPDRAAVFVQADMIVQVLSHGANDKNGAQDLPLLRRTQRFEMHSLSFQENYQNVKDCIALLRKRGAALVIGDHPKRPFQAHEMTADWTFVRFHWGARGRRGNYSESELEAFEERRRALAQGDLEWL